MAVATDKTKVSAYLADDLKRSSEALAKARGMSLSTLISFVLSKEVRKARADGELPSTEKEN